MMHSTKVAAPAPDATGNAALATAGAETETKTIETRFGPLSYRPDAAIRFPHGLVGFPDAKSFVLAELSDPRMSAFKLLQSLDNPGLSFIVTLALTEGGFFRREDIEEACSSLSVPPQRAAFLLVVTGRKEADKARISVNLRAPIVIDPDRQLGRQVVLGNSAYSIRHTL